MTQLASDVLKLESTTNDTVSRCYSSYCGGWRILLIIKDVSRITDILFTFAAVGAVALNVDILANVSKYQKDGASLETVVNDIGWRLQSIQCNVLITTHRWLSNHARLLGLPVILVEDNYNEKLIPYTDVDYVVGNNDLKSLGRYIGYPLKVNNCRSHSLPSDKGYLRRQYVAFPSGSGKTYFITHLNKDGKYIDQDDWVKDFVHNDKTVGWPKGKWWIGDSTGFRKKLFYCIKFWLDGDNDGKIMLGSEPELASNGHVYIIISDIHKELIAKRNSKNQPTSIDPDPKSNAAKKPHYRTVQATLDNVKSISSYIVKAHFELGNTLWHLAVTMNDVYLCGSQIESFKYGRKVKEISNIDLPYMYADINSDGSDDYDPGEDVFATMKSFINYKKAKNISDLLVGEFVIYEEVTEYMLGNGEYANRIINEMVANGVKIWMFRNFHKCIPTIVVDRRVHPSQDNRKTTDFSDFDPNIHKGCSRAQLLTFYSLCLIIRNPITEGVMNGRCYCLFSVSNTTNPSPSTTIAKITPKWKEVMITYPTEICDTANHIVRHGNYAISKYDDNVFNDWIMTNTESASISIGSILSISKYIYRVRIDEYYPGYTMGLLQYTWVIYHSVSAEYQTLVDSQTNITKMSACLLRLCSIKFPTDIHWYTQNLHLLRTEPLMSGTEDGSITGVLTHWPSELGTIPIKSKNEHLYLNGKLHIPVSVSGHIVNIVYGICVFKMPFCFATYRNTQFRHFEMIKRQSTKDFKFLRQNNNILEDSGQLVIYHTPVENMLGLMIVRKLLSLSGVNSTEFTPILDWFIKLFSDIQKQYPQISNSLSYSVEEQTQLAKIL